MSSTTSINSLSLVFVKLIFSVLISFYSDEQTFAQTIAKKARTATEDEPTTSTMLDDDVVVISPLCEAITHFPLESVGVEVVISDIGKGAREERHEEGRPEADPIVTPPSTTVPIANSSARTSIDEPVHTNDVPANEAADNQTMTTEVAQEETIPSQQTQFRKPSTAKHFSSSSFFVFLNLILSSISFLSSLSDLPPIHITIEGIAKDVVNEANKIAADEAAKTVHEEAANLSTKKPPRTLLRRAATRESRPLMTSLPQEL